MLMLFDGLDEVWDIEDDMEQYAHAHTHAQSQSQSRHNLRSVLRVLHCCFVRLPPWVRFLVSSRHHSLIAQFLSIWKPTVISNYSSYNCHSGPSPNPDPNPNSNGHSGPSLSDSGPKPPKSDRNPPRSRSVSMSGIATVGPTEDFTGFCDEGDGAIIARSMSQSLSLSSSSALSSSSSSSSSSSAAAAVAPAAAASSSPLQSLYSTDTDDRSIDTNINSAITNANYHHFQYHASGDDAGTEDDDNCDRVSTTNTTNTVSANRTTRDGYGSDAAALYGVVGGDAAALYGVVSGDGDTRLNAGGGTGKHGSGGSGKHGSGGSDNDIGDGGGSLVVGDGGDSLVVGAEECKLRSTLGSPLGSPLGRNDRPALEHLLQERFLRESTEDLLRVIKTELRRVRRCFAVLSQY